MACLVSVGLANAQLCGLECHECSWQLPQASLAVPALAHCGPCRLQANAVKVQKRLINKPRSGAQLAADVVERVLLTGGEKYLDTREHEMAWWQLSLLDVKLVLAVIVIVLLCVLCMLTWWLGVGIIAVGRLLIGYVTQVEKQKAP